METLLIKFLNILNINIQYKYISKILDFWELVITYNKFINLISRKLTEKDGFISHVVDSLTPMILSWPENILYMDLGAGGGFPGIPLAIVNPKWNTTLIESRRVKASFLEMAGNQLKLDNFQVKPIYLETAANDKKLKFDLISTRGFASLDKSLPFVAPCLKRSGVFLAFKGPKVDSELAKCDRLLEKYKLTVCERRDFTLPELNSQRTLMIFKKH